MRRLNFKNEKHLNKVENIVKNFAVKAKEDSKQAELTIYGYIGESYYDDSTSAKQVDEALSNLEGYDLHINLNSGGGSVFDGISIYNRLKNHDGKVTVSVDGYACSAASIIMLAGDEVIMQNGALAMIHEASSWVIGNKRDMRKEADLLEKIEDSIVDIYAENTSLSREELRSMMDEETWFNGEEAVKYGFATSYNSNKKDDKDAEIENLRKELAEIKNAIKGGNIEPNENTVTNEINSVTIDVKENKKENVNPFLNYLKSEGK